MPPPVLAPPPPASLPPRDAPPTLPVRPPLSRPPRREPSGRVTRSSLAGSLALHLLLGMALLVVLRHTGRSVPVAETTPRGAESPAGGSGGRDAVSYLELRDFPTSAGAPAPAAAAAAGGTVPALPQDSVFSDLPTLPHDVPRGIPALVTRPSATGPGASAGAPAAGPAPAAGGR
ncbi:MAG: hypothetical protein JWM27_2989, partial [Gemmatimonadetes bacterium]|nr:hypothetical protein [Gemmatimonadota bacterium]